MQLDTGADVNVYTHTGMHRLTYTHMYIRMLIHTHTHMHTSNMHTHTPRSQYTPAIDWWDQHYPLTLASCDESELLYMYICEY